MPLSVISTAAFDSNELTTISYCTSESAIPTGLVAASAFRPV